MTRGSRIVAEGSATNPIIFTTASVDNNFDGVADDDDMNGFPDAWTSGDFFLDSTPKTAPLAPLNASGSANSGLWGGLFVLGHAPTNLADNLLGYGQEVVPGLSGFGGVANAQFGGIEANDDSGALRYVSVRHAGAPLASNDENAALYLGSVGRRTRVDHVETYVSTDDGIEIVGGTVEATHLVVGFVGDDSIDLDWGYAGTLQFVFILQTFFNQNDGSPFGILSGDSLFEIDGAECTSNLNVRRTFGGVGVDNAPWPQSDPQLWNVTAIGSALVASPDFTPVSVASANEGIELRDGFSGRFYNSIFVNQGTMPALDIAIADCPCRLHPAGSSDRDATGRGQQHLRRRSRARGGRVDRDQQWRHDLEPRRRPWQRREQSLLQRTRERGHQLRSKGKRSRQTLADSQVQPDRPSARARSCWGRGRSPPDRIDHRARRDLSRRLRRRGAGSLDDGMDGAQRRRNSRGLSDRE